MIYGCGLFWGTLLCALTSCASIFAFNINQDECKRDYISSSGEEVNKGIIVEVPTYFTIAFICMMACHSISMLNTGTACLFSKCISYPARAKCSKFFQSLYMILLGFFGITWSVIGFIVYSDLGEKCQGISSGKMMLTFATLSAFYGSAFCCFGVLACVQNRKSNSLEMQFESL